MPVEQLSLCKWWGFPKVANHLLEVTGPRVFETSVTLRISWCNNSVYVGPVYVKYHSRRLN